MFSALFASFVAWSFSPFFRDSGNGDGGGNGSAKSAEQQQQQQQQRASSPPPPSASPAPILPAFLRDRLPAPRPPRFHTAVLYGRVLTTLCACQLLRALSFLSTSLPGPNYHCRAGSPAATLAMPRRWWGHLVVDVGEQATKGCGDLIFSSHTTFALVGCLAYAAFGNSRAVKAALWAAVAALSLLIVASRKHYTVDVVVAWYVVPLVWSFASRRWTTPERGSGGGEVFFGSRGRERGEKESEPFSLLFLLSLPLLHSTLSREKRKGHHRHQRLVPVVCHDQRRGPGLLGVGGLLDEEAVAAVDERDHRRRARVPLQGIDGLPGEGLAGVDADVADLSGEGGAVEGDAELERVWVRGRRERLREE